MNKLTKLNQCLFIGICLIFSNHVLSTTYGRISTEELLAYADAVIIGDINSINVTKGEDGDDCNNIASIEVLHSFKPNYKKGDKITVNVYTSSKINEIALYYLEKASETPDIGDMVSMIPSHIVERYNKQCKDKEYGDYVIIMEGIGKQKIVNANKENYQSGNIEFVSEWVIPPKIIPQTVVGEGRKEKTIMKVIDFINYKNN